MIAVSVVVPTYNRLHILKETVRRLLAQDFSDGDYQVIVVDDRSDDGSYEWLCQQAEAEERLRTARNPRKGRASARNTGIELARGEVICFLDDDMWVDPGFIEAHWRFHQRASPRLYVAVGKMQPWAGNEPTLANTSYDRRLTRLDGQMESLARELPCNYFCTGNISLPRCLLDSGVAFDEGFAGYSFEDTELGYCLAEHGVGFRYIPDARSEHRTDAGLQELLRKESEAGSTAVRLLQKYPQAAGQMQIPFEIPGVDTTRRQDSLPKTVAKAVFFWPLTGLILEGLLKTAAAVRWKGLGVCLLAYAGYHRYGRSYREAVREAQREGHTPAKEDEGASVDAQETG